MLFKLRSKMLNVKSNFSHKYQDNDMLLLCQQCTDNSLETQEHVIVCDGLKEKVNVNYSDLFSQNLDKVKSALIGYMSAWNQRLNNEEQQNIPQLVNI